jgi:ABC-type antimicrobial peptide transport system permease subunit
MALAKKRLTAIIFLEYCLMAALSTMPVNVAATSFAHIYGNVVDTNGRPVPHAIIMFWNTQQEITVKANTSGYYEANVTGWKSYWVYAYADDPSTQGADYVPAFRQISVKETDRNVSFTLLPGASVDAEGVIVSIESSRLPLALTFTVIDQSGFLNASESVTKYGQGLLSNYLLGLSNRIVIVPTNISFQVQANVYYPGEGERHFNIDLPHENLLQGEMISVNLRKYALGADADRVYSYITSAQALAGEAEGKGFYVAYEKYRLSSAEDLTNDARSALAGARFDEAFSDLQEAYLVVGSVKANIASLYENATRSVVFITPFIALTVWILAALFTENRRGRLGIDLVLFIAFIGLLYVLYPGYANLQTSTVNPLSGTSWGALFIFILAGASFLTVFLVVHWHPFSFREKGSREGLRPLSALLAVFSMAARNLRQRKFRTILMVILTLVSVFAFMAMTSFAQEYGFFVEALQGQPPSEGFLLTRPSASETQPFKPLEPALLQEIQDWLGERLETALVVVKLENMPQSYSNPDAKPYGKLESALGRSFSIWGALGVYPSLEVQVTKMDQIVEQGHFLRDEDLNGILISGEAANYLRVGVNDTVTFSGLNFTVSGIFNSKKLEGVKDLDGETVLPYVIQMQLTHCQASDVVIVNGETARSFPEIAVSRVDVQTRSSSDIVALARLMVLRWTGFEAYTAVAGMISRLSIGGFNVVSGFASTIIPLVIVALNVGVVAFETVHERKREVATMASLGMNPFHISGMFVAESLVMAIVAGSLGYILGLTSYRFMAAFGSFEVKQKVEPIWGILALSLSITTSVLGAALPAIQSSAIVTPSLLRKWKIEEKPKTSDEPWLFNLPLRIRGEESETFFAFMVKQLGQATSREYGRVENLKVSGVGAETHLTFTYIRAAGDTFTQNDLFLTKDNHPNQFIVRLTSKADSQVKVQNTASSIRLLLLQYSTEQHTSEEAPANGRK